MQDRQGIVVSDKMDKTVVVEVSRTVKDPLYKRYIRQNVSRLMIPRTLVMWVIGCA